MTTLQKIGVGITVILAVLGGIAFFRGSTVVQQAPSLGATAFQQGQVQSDAFIFTNGFSAGSTQQYIVDASGNVTTSGLVTSTGGVTIGSTGTKINGLNYGQCVIASDATTIAASTSAQIDCASGYNGKTALAGVSAGDTVNAFATTTLSTLFNGVNIIASGASSTPGFITIRFDNETGATFTWTGAASSSIRYIDLH